jgi:hypothetical protein
MCSTGLLRNKLLLYRTHKQRYVRKVTLGNTIASAWSMR